MAFVHLLDSIIQAKKQNKQVIFKGITLGNEVFKTIIAMAYEMDAAERLMDRVKQGLLEFSYERKYKTRFRDDKDIYEDITKVWKVVHTNKKQYEKMDDETDQWFSKRKIPITISGTYSVFVRVIKYVSGMGNIRAYLEAWRESDEFGTLFDEENTRINIHLEPTTTTVSLIKRTIREKENDTLREQLDDIFWTPGRGRSKNKQVWMERLEEMKQRKLLRENLSS